MYANPYCNLFLVEYPPLVPMQLTNSSSPITSSSSSSSSVIPQHSTCVDFETYCWGCGLYVIVSPSASVFKCGWCGAITNLNDVKIDIKNFRWRRFRDRCFVCILLLFMLFFICGGIWAVYPVVFSISVFCGILHLSIATLMSISTVSSFFFAAFRPAGAPPTILWGSYPTVREGGLKNYTFCYYCSKPKSPRAHHCRSCGTCILDMDHHCPFIDNCVGAANHRCFVLFLISTVISTIYVAIMTSYAALFNWPALNHVPLNWNEFFSFELFFRVLKAYVYGFLGSVVFLSARGILLLYLFIASVSVGIGLIVLLWQQLRYIYMGQTYLSHISANNQEKAQKDCQNLVKFFGCPCSVSVYLPSYWKSKKIHMK